MTTSSPTTHCRTSTQRQLPSFVCIGGQRCGSSWLHNILKTHPQVVLPKRKESSFFNFRIKTEGIEWYINLFEDCSDKSIEHIKGEVVPTYSAMFRDEVFFVKKLISDLKIILIIRNPVERMISQITRQWTYHYVDKGASTKRSLLSLLRQVDTRLSHRLTDFNRSYHLWSEVFGKENVLVMNYDALAESPTKFIDEITDFLQVSKFSDSDLDLTKRKNQSRHKEDIPEFLYWYLSVEWLPMAKELYRTLEDPYIETWIEDMIRTSSTGKLHWTALRWFHKAYFVLPYTFFYAAFNFLRAIRRKARNEDVIRDHRAKAVD